MNADKRRAIYETLRELNPHPTTELEFNTPFELLTAVMLSAQATDVSVNKAMRQMFPVANTPATILALGEAGVTQYIKTIGLYKTKARNLIALCNLLLEKHGGQVPQDREALEALPGVGRKTANVILNTAFGHPLIAVDTHIFRVANRTGMAPGKDVTVVETKLVKFTPDEFLHDAHHWLLLHGRYVCKARRPECWHCAIEPLCEYRDKTPAPSDEANMRQVMKVANQAKTLPRLTLPEQMAAALEGDKLLKKTAKTATTGAGKTTTAATAGTPTAKTVKPKQAAPKKSAVPRQAISISGEAGAKARQIAAKRKISV
ncbi:endonuclease III [Robbsia andropogonis]